ncbi:4Fe-4S dicluster domain-containing protein [Nitrospina watsonii]|uniref:Ferredoxin, Fe-S protein subunit of Succinate dehydrogenase or L-aspartate oxidase n=1 Tax=Nitrospina watsonii TaxID=1323948 RepID=A0ABM9HFS2_9BACT|nr:4Fe-4S dicluster domain-containing protein [Nitrospina watsonii]CAI2718883.1 putative Ferredoxin, Fe-S protein subunit of Succinate dehydrogenase or L-aspartate oxidase [Nitrospina watsonii]
MDDRTQDNPEIPGSRKAEAVEILWNGRDPIPARAGETIVHALWNAGQGGRVRTGCVGGVCGACTVTVRLPDGRPSTTELACMCPVENGMQVFPFAVDAITPVEPKADADADDLRAAYPTLDRCTKCGSCTVACPMSIPVMESVLRMQKGEFEQVAEDFTTCIHCGLCRAVCEDKVKPHNMGLWVRRSLGMSRDVSMLEKRVAALNGDGAEQEWNHLMKAQPEERLERARRFRQNGGAS